MLTRFVHLAPPVTSLDLQRLLIRAHDGAEDTLDSVGGRALGGTALRHEQGRVPSTGDFRPPISRSRGNHHTGELAHALLPPPPSAPHGARSEAKEHVPREVLAHVSRLGSPQTSPDTHPHGSWSLRGWHVGHPSSPAVTSSHLRLGLCPLLDHKHSDVALTGSLPALGLEVDRLVMTPLPTLGGQGLRGQPSPLLLPAPPPHTTPACSGDSGNVARVKRYARHFCLSFNPHKALLDFGAHQTQIHPSPHPCKAPL